MERSPRADSPEGAGFSWGAEGLGVEDWGAPLCRAGAEQAARDRISAMERARDRNRFISHTPPNV